MVPITDAGVRAKIHQTYRIGYLKDVVLARVLDDATFSTLSSLVLFNNVEVRFFGVARAQLGCSMAHAASLSAWSRACGAQVGAPHPTAHNQTQAHGARVHPTQSSDDAAHAILTHITWPHR